MQAAAQQAVRVPVLSKATMRSLMREHALGRRYGSLWHLAGARSTVAEVTHSCMPGQPASNVRLIHRYTLQPRHLITLQQQRHLTCRRAPEHLLL